MNEGGGTLLTSGTGNVCKLRWKLECRIDTVNRFKSHAGDICSLYLRLICFDSVVNIRRR